PGDLGLERYALSPVILDLAASPLERYALSPVILDLAASPLERYALSPVILDLAASPLELVGLDAAHRPADAVALVDHAQPVLQRLLRDVLQRRVERGAHRAADRVDRRLVAAVLLEQLAPGEIDPLLARAGVA